MRRKFGRKLIPNIIAFTKPIEVWINNINNERKLTEFSWVEGADNSLVEGADNSLTTKLIEGADNSLMIKWIEGADNSLMIKLWFLKFGEIYSLFCKKDQNQNIEEN